MIAKNGSIEIFYEVLGTREPPVLLIEGIGYSSWMWAKQVLDLPRKRQMVVFDNRGVGRSSSPAGAYSMKDMAEDVQAVVEAAKIEKCYVLGVSMGGMIAQEYYFSHRDRVAGLVLSNTNYGAGSTLPSKEVLAILSSTASTAFNFEGLTQRMRPALSKRFVERHASNFEDLVNLRLNVGDDAKGYMGQLYAVAGFASHERLSDIHVPTLVITAEEDAIVPPANSYELHARIPSSRLLVFKDAGHLLCVERSDDFDREVMRFVDEAEAGSFSRAEDPLYL